MHRFWGLGCGYLGAGRHYSAYHMPVYLRKLLEYFRDYTSFLEHPDFLKNITLNSCTLMLFSEELKCST